jgi:hypothetical protein
LAASWRAGPQHQAFTVWPGSVTAADDHAIAGLQAAVDLHLVRVTGVRFTATRSAVLSGHASRARALAQDYGVARHGHHGLHVLRRDLDARACPTRQAPSAIAM